MNRTCVICGLQDPFCEEMGPALGAQKEQRTEVIDWYYHFW